MTEIDKSAELVIANLVLPIIKDIISPKLQSLIKRNTLSKNSITVAKVEEKFEMYLSQRYEKYMVVDTLVFPNKQTLFDIIYEPLTVVTQDRKGKKVEVKINRYPESLIPKYNRILIEDTAGMGKSTITKKLFRSIITQKAGIPILIELRHINQKNTFLDELGNQLSPIDKKVSQDVIIKLIDEGGFIFLFDGLDEIPLVDRDFVIRELHTFIEKANQNNFLITSRPEDSLASFGDFQIFAIKPLTKSEAYSLINRYNEYSYKPIAKNLIEELKKHHQDSLKEFLVNPLLVSLISKSYEYKNDIPLKKSQFYRQVYDALFESHDLSKEGYLKREKYSNLHTDDFERVLRYIGFITAKENKIEYDKDVIINIIDKVKNLLSDINFKSSDYLKDLLETVPLFKKDGNYIKWTHKSLQDYFAAKFIWLDSKGKQESILRRIYQDNENMRLYNLIELFYELDYSTFETTILYWLLKDYQDYTNNSYTDLKEISKDSLKTRIENTFHKRCFIYVAEQKYFIPILKNTNEGLALYSNQHRQLSIKYKLGNSYTSIYYFNKPKVPVLTFIEVEANKNTILILLSNKEPKLVKVQQQNRHWGELKFLQQDHIYQVDDSDNNILNYPEIFDTINNLLDSRITFNHDEAIKRLNMIENNKSIKLNDDLTDW